MMKGIISATVTLRSSSGQPGMANAAEIHIWTARAIATVLEEVGPQFERASDHRLMSTAVYPPILEKRPKAGDPLDVLISGSGPSINGSKRASSSRRRVRTSRAQASA